MGGKPRKIHATFADGRAGLICGASGALTKRATTPAEVTCQVCLEYMARHPARFGLAPSPGIDALIERSSLGEPQVRALRSRTPPEAVRRVMERLKRLSDAPSPPARCRSCGCTDDDCAGCIERTGEPCYWVAPDLCSACVEVGV